MTLVRWLKGEVGGQCDNISPLQFNSVEGIYKLYRTNIVTFMRIYHRTKGTKSFNLIKIYFSKARTPTGY
jgi:hypothetical protein